MLAHVVEEPAVPDRLTALFGSPDTGAAGLLWFVPARGPGDRGGVRVDVLDLLQSGGVAALQGAHDRVDVVALVAGPLLGAFAREQVHQQVGLARFRRQHYPGPGVADPEGADARVLARRQCLDLQVRMGEEGVEGELAELAGGGLQAFASRLVELLVLRQTRRVDGQLGHEPPSCRARVTISGRSCTSPCSLSLML